jgi:hypothetical protein
MHLIYIRPPAAITHFGLEIIAAARFIVEGDGRGTKTGGPVFAWPRLNDLN